ncbi:MAG: type II secretion system protein [Desulfuromonadaceae bacterium]|nr:type II secretion system protein [Desulfuromonadaceae bacterium]MDD2854088.1 type II secretion system protein [Desulfuromonadaceae bacterium]
MNYRGFTLIEVLVVIAIMGILTSIAMLNFRDYSNKSEVESQTRKMYSDIMSLRSKALFEKHDVAIHLTTTGYSLYPSADINNPYQTTEVKKEITWNDAAKTNIIFDSRGTSNIEKSICVDSENDATVDSIIVSTTMIKLGKRTGTCDADHIDAKQ